MDPESSASYVHGAEEWRAIPGYEGRYEVSDQGRVQSLRLRGRGGRRGEFAWYDRPRPEPLILRGGRRSDGYSTVALAGATHLLHRLVLEAFAEPCPPGHECGHRNGDPSDNRLANLAWITSAENERDKIAHGTVAKGDRHGARLHPERLARGERQGQAKLTEAQVLEIRALTDGGASHRRLAAVYGVAASTIDRIASRQRWRHVEEQLRSRAALIEQRRAAMRSTT